MPEETGNWSSLAETHSQRALVPLGARERSAPQNGAELARYEPGAETLPPHVLIIPGDGVPTLGPIAPPVKPRRRTHALVVAVAVVVVVVALVSVLPLTGGIASAAHPFSALAASLKINPPPPYVEYRVLPGDTYEHIASVFGVALGGIFQLNNFYAGQEPQIGQMIRVPTDPKFGAHYVPPQLVMNHAGAGTANTNYFGSCMFCAAGGWTNGPGQPCAAGGTQALIAPTGFALINPDPNSHWVRGFRWDHNGVDLSTGQEGTPLVAAQTGVVIFAAWDPYGGGWSVKINHCGGFATSYSHMEKILVHVGQAVQTGQTLGLQGMTGNATGPHVHFMVWWNNTPFDPLCAYGTLDGIATGDHYGGCPAPQALPAQR